jgi:hypothetical protein
MGEQVLPATTAHVVIEEDCTYDLASGAVASVTVMPRRALTVMPSASLTISDSLRLVSGASFVNKGAVSVPLCTYIDTLAAGRNWYLSSPVASWDFASAFSPAGTPGGALLVTETYSEPTHAWQQITSAPDAGVGMVIQSETQPLAVAFAGGLSFSDITVPLTNTSTDIKQGFNLVGNPFPSYWRLTGKTVAAAGIYSTMWYRTYTPTLGYEYVAYNANSTVAAAPGWENASTSAELGYIPPMQAFWVRLMPANDSGTFTFDYASVEATGSGNRLRAASYTELQNLQDLQVDDLQDFVGTPSLRETKQSAEDEDTPPVIDVLVRLDVAKIDTTGVDQMVIYATKNAKPDFDDFDSEKMTDGGDRIRIYTKATDLLSTGKTLERELCIDGRPAIKVGDVIPLVFWAAYAGEFMLKSSEQRGCGDIAVWLVDKLANKEFKLNSGGIYYFSSRSGEIADRFTLEFRTAPVGNEVVMPDESFFAWSSAPGVISVRGTSAGEKVEVFNVLGRLIRTSSEIDRITGFAEFTGLERGIYFVRCKGESVKVVVGY